MSLISTFKAFIKIIIQCLSFKNVVNLIAKKQPKCPWTDEWIKKMWHVYIWNGILLSHKKNKIKLFAATQMQLGVIMTQVRSLGQAGPL